MVVLLVLVTFIVFMSIDFARERRKNAALLLEGESLHNALEAQQPRWVAGFKLPNGLSFHSTHTWVHWIAPDQAYIGLDDFARRLLGRTARYSVPPSGTVVNQGEPTITVNRSDARIDLRSPVGGEIIGINPRLKEDPDLPYRDAYGRGWIYKVRSPRLVKDLANLLSGSLADRWMEDTRDRFQHQLMVTSGSVIQDGGAPVEDIGDALDEHEWRTIVAEFLAPGPRR